MRITANQLRRIIKEEVKNLVTTAGADYGPGIYMIYIPDVPPAAGSIEPGREVIVVTDKGYLRFHYSPSGPVFTYDGSDEGAKSGNAILDDTIRWGGSVKKLA